MISKKQLVQITESAINRLIMTFKTNPYFFYTENDLHCHLFNEIFGRLKLIDWQCKTRDEFASILLHKEYPTKLRYNAKVSKKVEKAGARGHFDLCIWNPEKTEERDFRAQRTNFKEEQQTFIAIEFDLIERNDSYDSALHHFKWDQLKLTSLENEVEYGYQLVFVRDWENKNDFVEKARKHSERAANTTVLYVERNDQSKIVETLQRRHS